MQSVSQEYRCCYRREAPPLKPDNKAVDASTRLHMTYFGSNRKGIRLVKTSRFKTPYMRNKGEPANPRFLGKCLLNNVRNQQDNALTYFILRAYSPRRMSDWLTRMRYVPLGNRSSLRDASSRVIPPTNLQFIKHTHVSPTATTHPPSKHN